MNQAFPFFLCSRVFIQQPQCILRITIAMTPRLTCPKSPLLSPSFSYPGVFVVPPPASFCSSSPSAPLPPPAAVEARVRGASERIEGGLRRLLFYANRGEPNGPRGEGFTLGERGGYNKARERNKSVVSWARRGEKEEKWSVSPSIFERGRERRHWR